MQEDQDEAAADLQELFEALLQEAREKAAAQGQPAFYLNMGFDSYNESPDPPDLFLTDPQAGKVLAVEEVGGPYPGVPAPPEKKDLALYHGGRRRPGVLSLDYRRTAEGEAGDPLPALADTPAIWAAAGSITAANYAGYQNNPDGLAREQQVYFLDAPAATVVTINTESMARAQGDAIVRKMMDQANILLLKRESGTEYFITQAFKPTIVRVDDVAQAALGYGEVPPVLLKQQSDLDLAEPSESFCQIMQAKYAQDLATKKWYLARGSTNFPTPDIAHAETLLKIWTEKCEATRPILGLEGVNAAIAATEKIMQGMRPDDADYILAQARLDYWQAYKAGLEKTPDGYIYAGAAHKRPGEEYAVTDLERAEYALGGIAARNLRQKGGELDGWGYQRDEDYDYYDEDEDEDEEDDFVVGEDTPVFVVAERKRLRPLPPPAPPVAVTVAPPPLQPRLVQANLFALDTPAAVKTASPKSAKPKPPKGKAHQKSKPGVPKIAKRRR